MLRNFFGSFARSGRNAKRRPMTRRPLAFERLEERSLLTAVPTWTTLSASASSVVVTRPVTLTATVVVAPPNTGTPSGGTVTFFNGNTTLGTAALNSGTATLQVSTLPVGTDVLTTSYSGSGNFAGSSTALRSNAVITTVAGNGIAGYNSDWILGTAAEVNLPSGVAMDSAGNLFISDPKNHRVRELNRTTGVISTLAGNGTQGYSGDGGYAQNCELNYPVDIAVDAAGDVFIADSGSDTVREVNHATDVITTVAGYGYGYSGFAGDGTTESLLDDPEAVAVDAVGDLFIADTGNYRIREVSHATGIISTVAGNGGQGAGGDSGQAIAAELTEPEGVAVNSAGDLFIADYYNNRVREVNHVSGVITTIVGNGTPGYRGDGGQATAAELYYPIDIQVNAVGDLFIADSGNNRIREVNHATGVISTVAGNGTQGYGGDNGPATAAKLYGSNGVAIDAAGDLFIGDTYNSRVREVVSGAGITTVTVLPPLATVTSVQASASSVAFGQPVALTATVTAAVPNSGTPTGGTVTFLNGNTALGTAPLNSGTATLQVSTLPLGVDKVTARYSGDGGAFAGSTIGLGPNISTVAGVLSGGFNGDGIQATVAYLSHPEAVAADAAGDLFIADEVNCRIREVNHTTGLITTVAGTGAKGPCGNNGPATSASMQPTGIIVDAVGNLFIADILNSEIREVNRATGVITDVAGNGGQGAGGDYGPATAANLDSPYAVAVDAAGNLFIADHGNSRIREVNHATGLITTVVGNGIQGYYLGHATGVALDATGNLFIADFDDNRVLEVNHATGLITTIAGNGKMGYGGDYGPAVAAEMDDPEGLAVDANGDLFIADYNNNRIREVNLSTGIITTAAGTGSSGYAGDNGPATAAMLNGPENVALDAAGDLFIVDSSNNRICEVAASSAAVVTVTASPWVAIATGAFFGSGTTAVALQNQTTGLVAMWDESGGTRIKATFPAAPDPTIWKLLGTGDFNGDGTTDLLWQDQNPSDPQYGLVAMWLMDNAGSGNVKSFAFPSSLPLSTWRFLSVANFAGNGITDVAWRNENTSDAQLGLVGIWVMNTSGGLSSIDFPGTATPATWKLLGVGDFNGDGTADLAWQDQNSSDSLNGLLAMWLMSKNSPGATSSMTFPGTVPPATWKLLGMGDFDGNGTIDLAWRDQNSSDSTYGLVATWLMNTRGGLSGVTFPSTAPPASWKLLAIANVSQNTIADMVWQDVNTSDSTYGLVGIWLFNGGNVSQTTFPDAIDPCNMQLTVGNAVGINAPDLIWHNLATGQVLDWRVQSNGTVVQSSVLGTA